MQVDANTRHLESLEPPHLPHVQVLSPSLHVPALERSPPRTRRIFTRIPATCTLRYNLVPARASAASFLSFMLVNKAWGTHAYHTNARAHTHTQVDWFKLIDKEIDVVTRTTNAEIARVRSELSKLRDSCEQWSKEMKDKSAEQTGMRARTMLARMGVHEARVRACSCVHFVRVNTLKERQNKTNRKPEEMHVRYSSRVAACKPRRCPKISRCKVGCARLALVRELTGICCAWMYTNAVTHTYV
jgi:hypothetical protein